MPQMYRNKSANVHQFAMIPRSDVPRSRFRAEKTLKTTFDASYLIPIFCEEALPGDHWRLNASMFGRVATPIFPVMDNLYLETFFFFVPNRLVWTNWQKFMGEQANPADSIDYLVPQVTISAGLVNGGIYDYFGIPVIGGFAPVASYGINALPVRGYQLIWNAWFRDENLQNSVAVALGDGPDSQASYALLKRGKRKDYFTSCLPWPQKGAAVTLPLGSSAPVITNSAAVTIRGVTDNTERNWQMQSATTNLNYSGGTVGAVQNVKFGNVTGLVADLSAATASTINAIRLAFQTQKLLERDARGGTRYVELLQSHFGVRSPDARLQRPEYLGGGRQMVTTSPVAQTSSTDVETPQGNLAGYSTVLMRGHQFSHAFVEHGYVIGVANVRADLTYQQGLRRHWSRRTRYDYYWPVFAMLGEQAVLNKEIFLSTTAATDALVFGYQERWGEYRWLHNEITGLFRSDAAGGLTIDPWHYAQDFAVTPTLNATFIEEAVPLARSLAVGAAAGGQQILLDCLYSVDMTRPMPMYSVPGLVDHF